MNRWFFGLLIALALISGTGRPAPAVACSDTPVPTLPAEVRLFGDFEITLTTHPGQEGMTDVSVKKQKTGQVEFTITLPDVYARHYRPVEYYPGHLYIIRRVHSSSYGAAGWADELWRYDAQGRGEKLYTGRGIEFRVAPNEQLIAAESDGLILSLLDGLGRVLREFDLAQLSGREAGEIYADIRLSKWSDDSRVLWGELAIMGRPLLLYRLEADIWQPQRFDVSGLPLFWEDDLNPNTGQLVYSDYPALITIESGEEFEKSGQTVTLFVYDIAAQNNQAIATSNAKAFRPIWLNDHTIEYDNPQGEGRLTYSLDGNEPLDGQDPTGN